MATVRWIYAQFVDHGKVESEIAAALNARGQVTDLGRPWTRSVVHQILTNEKYIGNNIYNRKSFKLKRKRVANAPEMWIRADGAFEAIVDRQQFLIAQGIIRERNRRFSDLEMLERLRILFQRHGYISGLVIDEAEGMPSSGAYQHRFGSLLRAYQLVGFNPDRDYRYIEVNRALREHHHAVVESTIAAIVDVGGRVEHQHADLLRINGEFTASIVVARCQQTPAGSLRWKLRFDTGLVPDITIAIRMDRTNETTLDYYLLPQVEMTRNRLGLAEENGLMLDAYRFDTLEFFFAMAGRTRISEVVPW